MSLLLEYDQLTIAAIGPHIPTRTEVSFVRPGGLLPAVVYNHRPYFGTGRNGRKAVSRSLRGDHQNS